MKILTILCENKEQAAKNLSLGCDEVILVLKDGCFSALSGCTVEEITAIAKENSKRTAVLMNRLFGQEEIEQAQKTLCELLPQVDAVLFADPALLQQAKLIHMEHKMIYRPETLLTSAKDGAWWMAQGLQSVQISPLLTKEEILEIAANVPHAGLQIHGRLLMSVSKRKLLDAYASYHAGTSLHEKDGLYLREDSREGRMPVYENAYGTMIYTDYVQESFAYVPEFLAAGLERFEIDTYTLKDEEIRDAITMYRALLDGRTITDIYAQAHADLPLSSGYYGQKTIK
jgi:Collagenase and related proteases